MQLTPRERMLALVQGRELDRVPFVVYNGVLPSDEVIAHLGAERVGRLIWSRVHRVEHPHCHFDFEEYFIGEGKWRRTTLHTPAGAIYEERAYEPTYGTSSIRKHYVQEASDYEPLWAYLADSVILENYQQCLEDQATLGDYGLPLVAIERTPYQALWIQWVGIDNLAWHLADYPERVARTTEMLFRRERQIMEIAARSPAPFINFGDNITAPTIGPRRFQEFCVPLYDELAEMIAPRRVMVHMDGDLKPLWSAIAASKVGGLDSFSPAPDNDTTVAEAISMWPDKVIWANFPSSVHLCPYEQVRAEAEAMLAAGGHTGRLQIQISENVPYGVWRTSLKAITDAIEAFGKP